MPRTDGVTSPRVLLRLEPPLASLVALTLRHLAVETRAARSMEEATGLVRTWHPHLVIADYDREPRALELKRNGGPDGLPVVVMTRRRDTSMKLAMYERGAHDIIEVPFTPDEIVGRTVAALRRVHDIGTVVVPQVRVGELEVDVLRQTVKLDHTEFRLTPLQHTLLYLLVAADGQALTRDQIISLIWGSDEIVESNVVDRHVRDLRVKLQDSWREPRFIQTIPRKGYRFVPSPEAKTS